jgi:hypothetical protein
VSKSGNTLLLAEWLESTALNLERLARAALQRALTLKQAQARELACKRAHE